MKTRRIKKNLSGIKKNKLFTSWHDFRKVRYRLCGRCSTFASYGTDFAAGAALSPRSGTDFVQHFRKVRYRFRGRRSTFARYGTDFAAGSTFARSGTYFVAGAVLSQGKVQSSWHFRKIRYIFRGRRSTFTQPTAHFHLLKPLGKKYFNSEIDSF